MPNQSTTLDSVFHSLSDPTRRAVIQRLCRGPASVSELAQPFDMALPSFVQHLRVLEDANLIRSQKKGRIRTCEVVKDSLSSAEQWMAEQRAYWETTLDALADFVETEQPMKKRKGKS